MTEVILVQQQSPLSIGLADFRFHYSLDFLIWALNCILLGYIPIAVVCNRSELKEPLLSRKLVTYGHYAFAFQVLKNYHNHWIRQNVFLKVNNLPKNYILYALLRVPLGS
jgi:hypothetical protein